ncbi:LysM domain-containing protein [Klenkia soli]|uniref:LysM domain-containing protein n=1 Tax=Klenkia soli TaxID=1052260 RepID=A0A1H0SFY1_9ACTN|nr:LysM peptidoglycan-binding domain-containing protein [Klenkia soli]SDP40653.1 LysM domain-containing protein [Klenkia soli]
MASTASPLRTVPRSAAPGAAMPTALPAPVVRAQAGRGDLRRGNHPAGRALSRSAVATPGGSIAPVLPLRPAGAVVVPLRPGAPRAVPAPAVSVPAVPAVPVAPAAAADPAPVGPARLRLTRRGRVVLSGLGVVAALGVAAVVGPALGGAGDPALELAGRSSVVVHSGDTLWSIAESVAPDVDPRGVVDALREANGLEDTRLVPGQVLVLP